MNETEHNNPEGETAMPDKIAEIKIECCEPFELQTPDGAITSSGIRELQNYLYEQQLPYLPETFEFQWITKRGTLPKRACAFYSKEHKIKLTPAQISELGNIAKRNSDAAKTYILDITDSIDWNDGDFGDEGSCFWSSNSGAKAILEEHGYAIRAWKHRPYKTDLDYTSLCGYARAWLAPIPGNRLIVFNGYGEVSLVFARLLALKFSCAYKRITLLNNGSDTGTLYINGGSAYILGAQADIEKVERHDLQWDDCEPEQDDTTYCYNCDSAIDADDTYHALDRNGYMQTVCESCAHTCEECEVNRIRENVYDEIDCRYLCQACYESVQDSRAEAQAEAKQESQVA